MGGQLPLVEELNPVLWNRALCFVRPAPAISSSKGLPLLLQLFQVSWISGSGGIAGQIGDWPTIMTTHWSVRESVREISGMRMHFDDIWPYFMNQTSILDFHLFWRICCDRPFIRLSFILEIFTCFGLSFILEKPKTIY